MSMMEINRLAHRKADPDGKYRFTIALDKGVAQALYAVTEADRRSMSAELSYLIVERARSLGLDAAGHIA